MSTDEPIQVEYRDRVAIITLNQPAKLNALNQDGYYKLALAMHEVAARDDVYITVLTGKGRFFSAGADVSIGSSTAPSTSPSDTKKFWLSSFVSNNLHITHAFYTHPKILVCALNGPAVGLSAALIAFSDFIYAAPHAFLLTPSPPSASKKISCEELVQTGFVNKVFDVGGKGKSEEFLGEVLREVEDRLGSHLNGESLLGIKKLIRKPEMESLERQGVEEVFAGLQRFVKGVPQEEFRRVASGEKKHKL
ncbi:ClpP/crotonase-like domain-containing protein [Clohesyomyces aquaticus]|uniref:ClpP/crotonase-like domain-containing protein n=1 Tax=Clohesyomyces aquaticus TaxID=1231657 RepID=A0A1Y1YZW1_9PLEO|nr:ClpP/crotonase-like domain-containing protein [Clohesyomyces aquaticus]